MIVAGVALGVMVALLITLYIDLQKRKKTKMEDKDFKKALDEIFEKHLEDLKNLKVADTVDY